MVADIYRNPDEGPYCSSLSQVSFNRMEGSGSGSQGSEQWWTQILMSSSCMLVISANPRFDLSTDQNILEG
jgi:hypothetical protein